MRTNAKDGKDDDDEVESSFDDETDLSSEVEHKNEQTYVKREPTKTIWIR